VQVRLLARALWQLSRAGGLGAVFAAAPPEAGAEGWILGVGAEAALRAALDPPAA